MRFNLIFTVLGITVPQNFSEKLKFSSNFILSSCFYFILMLVFNYFSLV